MTIDITNYATVTSIPKRVLRYLNREGIIQDPLCREDLIGLRFLEKLWGRKEVLRAQLSRLSMKARLNFLRTADLPTKWERYAYSRLRSLNPGKKLAMHTVIEEIQTTFYFLLNKQQINRLYKIRNRVQVARHREKNRTRNEQQFLLQSTNK